MKELLANLYRKIGSAAQEWIAEREKDQKRLDWLDHNATRMKLAADRMISQCSVREAIDELMQREKTEET